MEKSDLHDLALMAYHLFSNYKKEQIFFTQNKKDKGFLFFYFLFFYNLSQKVAKQNRYN